MRPLSRSVPRAAPDHVRRAALARPGGDPVPRHPGLWVTLGGLIGFVVVLALAATGPWP